jgi:hypothetical protein
MLDVLFVTSQYVPVGPLRHPVIFVQVQGRRKFQPQEYIEYFED